MTIEIEQVMFRHINLIITSLTVFLVTKLLWQIHHRLAKISMNQHRKLEIIPEYTESDDLATEWVPKNKHDVLKVKYKCLKKLFQIYDTSLIGAMSEKNAYRQCDHDHKESNKRRKKKRSHRTKTDACAGTTEIFGGDTIDINGNHSKFDTIDTSVRDVETNSTAENSKSVAKLSKSVATQFFDAKENEAVQTCESLKLPYLMVFEKRKLTRFQCFVYRLLGLSRERTCKKCVMPDGHILASSDNNIVDRNVERRRRRTGLRFRSLRYLGGKNSKPVTYSIQSVQINCLLDTTPRYCPIAGCGMMFYGIINYNDHLNLMHFIDRKFFCLYCHEGFDKEHDKCVVHENSHLLISRSEPTQPCQSYKKTSITQTDPLKVDVQDENLKNIVTFFDKMANTSEVQFRARKNPYSDSNLRSAQTDTTNMSAIETGKSSKTISCMNVCRNNADTESGESDVNSNYLPLPDKCRFCGETFDYRRQNSLHVNLEHRIQGKLSKYQNSCMNIFNMKAPTFRNQGTEEIKTIKTEEGIIGVGYSTTTMLQTSTTLTDNLKPLRGLKSEDTLSFDPSTNIIYYSSTELVKSSKIDDIFEKVRAIKRYKWEPETKIIRV